MILSLLDHGSVELLRTDGTDGDIAAAARTSTREQAHSDINVEADARLISRLMRDEHQSPFEQVGVQVHIKLPIFVMRQLVRHRVIALNEYSGRYSEIQDCFYVPALTRVQAQSTFNKQGSAEMLPIDQALIVQARLRASSERSFADYRANLDDGLSRELARIILPVNFYTVIVAKVSLRGLFQFLLLRLDAHAQYEIRVYADALLEIAREQFPVATAAFERYVVNTRRLSIETLQALISGTTDDPHANQLRLEFTQ